MTPARIAAARSQGALVRPLRPADGHASRDSLRDDRDRALAAECNRRPALACRARSPHHRAVKARRRLDSEVVDILG
jgi:hypothetical protein